MPHRTGWAVAGIAAVALAAVLSGAAGASATTGSAPRDVVASPDPSASGLPFDPSRRGAADVVNSNPPSGHRCAKVSRRSVRGTIRGQDGLAVKAQIGFDIVDAKGQKVDLATGCPLGAPYSAWASLNLGLHADGVPFGTPLTSKTYVGDSFVLMNLPANASHIYAESYPRGPSGLSHYGQALRRYTPLRSSVTSLPMTAPTTKRFGGSTGAIVLRGSTFTFAYARSDAPDGTRLMGWNYGNPIHGALKLGSLASRQTYTLVVTYRDGHQSIKAGVLVRPNRTTYVSF